MLGRVLEAWHFCVWRSFSLIMLPSDMKIKDRGIVRNTCVTSRSLPMIIRMRVAPASSLYRRSQYGKKLSVYKHSVQFGKYFMPGQKTLYMHQLGTEYEKKVISLISHFTILTLSWWQFKNNSVLLFARIIRNTFQLFWSTRGSWF